MRRSHFYTKLRRVTEVFALQWFVTQDGQLRVQIPGIGFRACPIEAVGVLTTGSKYGTKGYIGYARDLGLFGVDLDIIVDAADNVFSGHVKARCRQALLRATKVPIEEEKRDAQPLP